MTQIGDSTTYSVIPTEHYDSKGLNALARELTARIQSPDFAEIGSTLVRQEDGTYKLDGLADGYYLVISSVGEALILDTIGDITVTTKNEYPSLDKFAREQSGTIGKNIEFSIDVTIPENASGEIVVHDKMVGLEYVGNVYADVYEILEDGRNDILELTIDLDDGFDIALERGEYLIKEVKSDLEDGCDLHFVIPADTVEAWRGYGIRIGYQAKLTANVARNEAWLVDHTYTSKPDEVKVYSTPVIIDKYDGHDGTKLEGAQFILGKPASWAEEAPETERSIATYLYYKYDAENNIVTWTKDKSQATVVTTDANGYAEFIGLDCGWYVLIEVKAPDGYNQLTEAIEIVVGVERELEGGLPVFVPELDEDGNVVEYVAHIENNAGTELPSTGGMGTTLFYVFGAVMMLGAAVLLVTKRRMAAAE